MKSKHLLLALLLALMAPWAVAQQSLPYSYGFENGNLATDGWTNTGGGISNYYSDGIHSGSYYFYFYWNISTDVYLVSPLLTGAETQGLDVTFWYKALDEDYLDIFKVGYTTDANNTDPSTFTYGEDYITASTDWVQYEETFPAGTVRVAIMYDADNYDYGDYLALDDFVFDVHSNCAKPEDLNIAYTEGETTATVTWTSDAPSFNINVNGVTETVATNSYTIENIEPLQSFNVSVQAVCAEEPSGWVSESFFSGCPETFAIPYAEGFENPNTINCWTLSPANNMGVDATEPDYAHTGNNFLILSYTTNPPQYVISPELSGIQNGLHVEFYYRQYTQGVETFHVGYSTTDNDPDSFEWGEEITASTTYQRFSANYPAGTKYVAIKHTANDQYYLFLDDFLFEEVASCMETAITGFTNVSTEGATANWNEASGRVTYDLYVTTDATDVPDDATTPTASGINGTSYPLTSLNSGTNYYVYVRVVCSATDHSAWSPAAVLTTVCETIPLPYSYDFNDEELPVCWNVINTNTSYNDIRIMKLASDNPDAVLAMFFGSYATADLIAVLPEIDETYDVSNYQIEFDACYANSSSTSMTSGSI